MLLAKSSPLLLSLITAFVMLVQHVCGSVWAATAIDATTSRPEAGEGAAAAAMTTAAQLQYQIQAPDDWQRSDDINDLVAANFAQRQRVQHHNRRRLNYAATIFDDYVDNSSNDYLNNIYAADDEDVLLTLAKIGKGKRSGASRIHVYRRGCIRRNGACDNRPNDCCFNTSCRCNLWGSNCRCQRMGLFQKWG